MPALYWPYYCEENIWHLCGDPQLATRDAEVILISNRARSVALWRQRAGAPPEGFVVWDYHVVLATRLDARWFVHDLDSTLPGPAPAGTYLEATFGGARELSPRFVAGFRVVSAREYRDRLCSDRSHMRAADGSVRAPVPPWPLIGDGEPSNLMELTDVHRDGPGELLDLDQLARRYAGR